MLEYVAKFTELARFRDDYVTTDMAKVRRFEEVLKLSIRGKIVGFLIQNMDSMVTTTMAIEREIEDARSIRDTGTGGKRKRAKLLPVRERSRRLPIHKGFKDRAATIRAKARPELLASLSRSHVIIAISLNI